MFRLSNFRIGTKLTIMSGLGILLVLGMIGASMYGNSLVKSSNEEAMHQQSIAHEITKIEAAFVTVRLAVRNIRLAESAAELKSANNLEGRQKAIDKQFEELVAKFRTQANRDLAEKLHGYITQYITTALKETVPTKTKALGLDPKESAGILALAHETQRIQHEDLDPGADKGIALLKEFSDARVKQAEREGDNAEQQMVSSGRLGMGIGAAVILVLIGSAIFGAMTIASPLRKIASVLNDLATGNKAVEVPYADRGDEIGDNARAAKTFKENLLRMEQLEAEQKEAESRTAAEREAAMQKMAAEFEAAVGGIVQAAVAGDFSQRVDLQGKTGMVLNIGTAINSLCENVAKALDDLIRMLNSLAAGDLTDRITAQYQGNFAVLKENANKTAERIGATIAEIKASAQEVTNASAEISGSTTDLSQRTEEQAASLEETSASMEEISATVKKNAENAQLANVSASATRDVADRGGQVVAKAVEAMAKIEDSSRNISDIIGVIDEIARQTNLLALNAAVEAARAGEAGRGFAVVASEVRSLAQRSSQAAKDIKDLITNSNEQVKGGVDLVNRAGASLSEILDSIKKVAEIVADIANASAEQASGIEQVNKALTQMDEVTQQNSALVEENAATAKTLEHQAKAMDERVSFFKLDDAVGHRHAAQPTVVRDQHSPAAVPLLGPAAKKPVAEPKQAAAGGNGGGPVARMQTVLAAAVNSERNWKEF